MKLAADVSANEKVQSQFAQARNHLREGENLAKVLEVVDILPPGAISMLLIGEETGKLATMAQSVAKIYEEGTELAIATFASLMEPLLMLVMGLMTGFLVMSAILPIVKLLESLG